MDVYLRPLSDTDSYTRVAWAELAAHAIEPNPFFEPIFVLPFARHLELDIVLLTVEQGAHMLFCLPMMKATLNWRGLPLPAWRTWNPLSTPLMAATNLEDTLASALFRLSSLHGPRLLVLEYLATDGPIAAALHTVAAGRRRSWPAKELSPLEAVRPALYRREDGQYFATTLHGKHKSKLAQKRRFLERLVDDSLTLVDQAGNVAAVERLLSIEASGWKGQIGSAVACNPRRAKFFHDICAAFATQGRLQLLTLQGAGKTLAMKCNLRSGDTTFALRRTYDEYFAHGSPGTQLEIQAVEVFHASGDRFLDSCGNSSKDPDYWMWPNTRPLTRFITSLDQAIPGYA